MNVRILRDASNSLRCLEGGGWPAMLPSRMKGCGIHRRCISHGAEPRLRTPLLRRSDSSRTSSSYLRLRQPFLQVSRIPQWYVVAGRCPDGSPSEYPPWRGYLNGMRVLPRGRYLFRILPHPGFIPSGDGRLGVYDSPIPQSYAYIRAQARRNGR